MGGEGGAGARAVDREGTHLGVVDLRRLYPWKFGLQLVGAIDQRVTVAKLLSDDRGETVFEGDDRRRQRFLEYLVVWQLRREGIDPGVNAGAGGLAPGAVEVLRDAA